MWARVSFPLNLNLPNTFWCPLSNRKNLKPLQLRPSLFDYPLASRIMVKNLPYSTSESCLRKEFANFGEIAEVMLVKDEKAKRSKGYAYIQYTCQDDAMLALEEMDCKSFGGRVISVELASPTKGMFGGYPRTSGPPMPDNLMKQDME